MSTTSNNGQEPTYGDMKKFIDSVLRYVEEPYTYAAMEKFNEIKKQAEKFRKEKPARVGIATVCELDNPDDCFNAVETTPEVIARLGPTAGVDWGAAQKKLDHLYGNAWDEGQLQSIRDIVAGAAPEIDGEL